VFKTLGLCSATNNVKQELNFLTINLRFFFTRLPPFGMGESIGGSSSAASRMGAFAAAAAITVSEDYDENTDPDVGTNIDNIVSKEMA